MKANFTLLPEATDLMEAGTKKAVLHQLACRFADAYGLDRDLVSERLEQREALGSTGFGRGFAIPHARIPGLRQSVSAFLKLESPVDFGSPDGIPVNLVFGLLSPENSGPAHLHALAAISRILRDERMREMLNHAKDPEALYGLLCNVSDRDAA
ncbi:MAG: PTS sugar transporter subunit IIA [Novosphingobium sp.]|nr:PTS sugar transporter subunit IIA [Novosphingobium sp.]